MISILLHDNIIFIIILTDVIPLCYKVKYPLL